MKPFPMKTISYSDCDYCANCRNEALKTWEYMEKQDSWTSGPSSPKNSKNNKPSALKRKHVEASTDEVVIETEQSMPNKKKISSQKKLCSIFEHNLKIPREVFKRNNYLVVMEPSHKQYVQQITSNFKYLQRYWIYKKAF